MAVSGVAGLWSGGRTVCPYDTIRRNGRKNRASAGALLGIPDDGSDARRRRSDRGLHRASTAPAAPGAAAPAAPRAGTDLGALATISIVPGGPRGHAGDRL